MVKYSARGIHEGRTANGLNYETKRSNDLELKKGMHWFNLVLDIEKEMRKFVIEYLDNVFIVDKDTSFVDPYKGIVDHLNFKQGSPCFYPAQQIQHYPMNKGHFHKWHYDDTPWTDIKYKHPVTNEAIHCRRIFVVMYYLNTVEKGGETEFKYTDLSIKPVEGRGVIFPAGFPFMHRGNTPESSDKLILTSWLTIDTSGKLAGLYNTIKPNTGWTSMPILPLQDANQMGKLVQEQEENNG